MRSFLNSNKTQALAVVLGLTAVHNASAINKLQLDSEDGVYDSGSETTVSTADVFDLYALGKAPSGTYFLSAAITPNPGESAGSDFGSFKIGGTTYSSATMTFGTPPVQTIDKNELPSHGIFPTWFAEQTFTFGADTVPAYNVQDGATGPGVLNIQTFGIDLTELTDGYSVHFDLYNIVTDNRGKTSIGDFAPFSHDAQGTPGTNVPDGGATAVLLGLGVLSLSMFRRKS
jgi:hypothetical protein